MFLHMCAKRKDLFLQKVRLFSCTVHWPSEIEKVRRQILHTYKSGWTLRGMSNGALFSPKLLDSALDARGYPRIHVSHSHPMYNPGSPGLPRNPLSPTNLVRVWQCKGFIPGPSILCHIITYYQICKAIQELLHAVWHKRTVYAYGVYP